MAIYKGDSNPDVRQLARYTLEARHGDYVSRHDALEGVADALSLDRWILKAQQSLALPAGPDQVPVDDITAALRLLPSERTHLDRLERALIERALDLGMTWQHLSRALGGGSRQAMQQRYRRVGGTRTWSTRHAPTGTSEAERA